MINGRDTDFLATERLFWLGIRKALIEFIRAIEIRYSLDSAIITAAQRKRLRREDGAEFEIDIGKNIG